MSGSTAGNAMDPEEAEPLLPWNTKLSGIADLEVRHGFAWKVYGILGVQLLLTTGLAWAVTTYGRVWIMTSPGTLQTLTVVSLFASMALMCVFICRPDTMRESPANYLVLFGFTVTESVVVGVASITYTTQSLLLAFGVTAVVVLALSVFALQTTYDITGFAPYFLVMMVVLMCFGLVVSLVGWAGLAPSPAFQTMRLLYAFLGVLIFCGFIVMDTQMIIGGRHKEHQFMVDEYAMAAIVLYVDIIQLFLFFLELLGDKRRD